MHAGRVRSKMDLKGAPYRDDLGNPVRGVIRKMLMEATGILRSSDDDADLRHTDS